MIVSLCHNRGGHLHDPAVCDTPPLDPEPTGCDVMEHTLFVDWQGKAHTCDHDLDSEQLLGDLLHEPLATILERRRQLLAAGLTFKMCRECNDVMRHGPAPLLARGRGGNFRDWVYHLHREQTEPLAAAPPTLR